jgi:competence protein ComEC
LLPLVGASASGVRGPAHAWTTLFAACEAMTLWDLGFRLSALVNTLPFAYGKGTEALLLKTPLWVG